MRSGALLMAAILSVAGPAAEAAEKKEKPIVGIARVIDAGTIQIENKIINLFGIVAPTSRQKCLIGSLPWLCGATARTFLKEMVDRKEVTCMPMGGTTARCILGRKDISNEMVLAGWAVADEVGEAYRPAQDIARADKRGLWRSVPD